MKEDDAPESIRAEVVLPLMSSIISKQADCGGRAVHEDEKTEMAPVELELGIVLDKDSGVSRELELFAERGKLKLLQGQIIKNNMGKRT